MSEVKYFDGSNRRLNNLINGFKIWVVNKITEWWGTLTMTHDYSKGNTWGYKVSLDNVGGDIQNSPILHLASNDWKYSDWVKSTSDGNFAITCAPRQANNIVNGEKYINYYVDTVFVTPSYGNMLSLGTVYSGGFTVKNGTATQAIMANGTTKEISTMPSNMTVSVVTATPCIEFKARMTLNIAYKLSDTVFNTLKYTDFFQTLDEGLTFSRTNDSASGYPRFVTKFISHLDIVLTMVAYVVKNNGNFTGCNYAICFTVTNGDTSGNLNDFPPASNVYKIDSFFEFGGVVS